MRNAYLLFIDMQRGKSENKFYAAMRDKEALENERKNLTRNIEKQTKVIERLQESERNLALQVVRLSDFLITKFEFTFDSLGFLRKGGGSPAQRYRRAQSQVHHFGAAIHRLACSR